MIVIVLRSSRTCHNMNVRLGEIHFRSSLFTQHDIVNPRAVRRRPTIASKMIDFDPPPEGVKKWSF